MLLNPLGAPCGRGHKQPAIHPAIDQFAAFLGRHLPRSRAGVGLGFEVLTALFGGRNVGSPLRAGIFLQFPDDYGQPSAAAFREGTGAEAYSRSRAFRISKTTLFLAGKH